MLTYEEYGKLKKYCDEKGITFLSTAFDLPSVDYLHSIGMKMWKIQSGEITNLEPTGEEWGKWETSTSTTVKFPKGIYEITIRFLGYDYNSEIKNKGKINWIELT